MQFSGVIVFGLELVSLLVSWTGGLLWAADPPDCIAHIVSHQKRTTRVHRHAYGRPVGVAMDPHGALLVADDVGNAIWRVSGPQQAASPRN